MSIRDRFGQSRPPEIHAMIAALTGSSNVPFTVVGIVGIVGRSRPSADQPHVFVALRQQFQSRILVAVRAEVDVSVLAESLQAAIMSAASGLGALALILSAIGVYGVVAFAVANRTREVGLRTALGATRGRVLRAILADAVCLSIPGLVVGTLMAGDWLRSSSPICLVWHCWIRSRLAFQSQSWSWSC